MGLDMQVYEKNKTEGEDDIELHYWRKHNALHNWMEGLWNSKGGEGEFNQEPVELTSEDLLKLEIAVRNRSLKPTDGFFFGSSEYSEEDWEFHTKDDLEFIEKAMESLDNGNKIYYTSWW